MPGSSNNFASSQLSLGEHNITLRVQDNDGEWSVEVSTELIINGIPTAHIDYISPNPALHNECVVFIGNGTDDGTIKRYVWRSSIDGILQNSSSYIFFSQCYYQPFQSRGNDQFLSNGTHTIYLKVQDDLGAWSDEVSEILAVNGRPMARVVSIFANPAVEGDSILFVGYGTDDVTVEKYMWTSFTDGEIFSGSSPTFTYSTLSVGTHIILLKVQDNEGAWSELVSMEITILRDTDGDMVPDMNDTFPNDSNEWNDTDEDGIGDNSDSFPNDPSASKDSDSDGYPDKWNEKMTEEDSTTGLKLDIYPDDPEKWKKEDSNGGGFLPGFEAFTVIGVIGVNMLLCRRRRKEIMN